MLCPFYLHKARKMIRVTQQIQANALNYFKTSSFSHLYGIMIYLIVSCVFILHFDIPKDPFSLLTKFSPTLTLLGHPAPHL